MDELIPFDDVREIQKPKIESFPLEQGKRFFAQGKIEAYCGPKETGAPDDLEAVIINFINEAQETLQIAVQELDSLAIAQAIIDAKWRGVRVEMYLEQDYLLEGREAVNKMMISSPDEESREFRQWNEHADNNLAENRKIFAALLRNGIDVKADYNPDIFHQKFIIRDMSSRATTPPPAVLTGSTNFTITCTHSNLNHIVIFHDHRIAGRFNEEFKQLKQGRFGQRESTRSSKLNIYNLGGVPVRILFSPDNVPELEVAKQMLKASRLVDFAIFTFSGSSVFDDVMVMLSRAGVKIRGVFDSKQGNQEWSSREWLQRAGIEFYYPDLSREPFKSNLRKVHHKLMVVDDDIVIGGSMNYTAPANEFNDENVFVLGSPYPLEEDDGGPVNHTACIEIARFFRQEIQRMISLSYRQEKKKFGEKD
jgi:phosphatidylserine/phosphatidylglycerophosphate/cardiolipin synthase-like enzyme